MPGPRIDSTAAETLEPIKRVEGLKKRVPERVTHFVVALCADQARDVSGRIFGVRNNQIFLFSQPRPIRSAHRSEGWTPESVLGADFYDLDRSSDIFTWDPV